MKSPIFARLLSHLLPFKVIVNCQRQPYLYRWYLLRTKWVAIFIHRFVRSDEDRALHDHPWPFVVIPIWRGYREHNERGVARVWPLLGARFRRSTYRHRVELLKEEHEIYSWLHDDPVGKMITEKPSWSLFIRFRECRDWGFWMPSGFVQWNQFWREKCE